MSIVTKHIKATPAEVYRVITDAWDYSQWVVGTWHVRAVDASWPAQGSRMYHAVGAWPLVLRDHTEVQKAEVNKRLLMTARGWPVGQAEVEITLEPDGAGTRLSIREEGTGGAGWLLRNPIGHALIYRRNVESAARLAALAERRTTPSEDA